MYTPQYRTIPPVNGLHYVIGVHPLHNPERLMDVFGPIADLFTEKIEGVDFSIEASRNYAAFDEKLYSGEFEFALPNPYQTVLSLKHNYKVFGKMSDDHNFQGIILVRKDSKITDVMDLKGKNVCFPAPTALAATMMPQYYLHEHGLDVGKDITVMYVGSQESSIMNVFMGNAAAGATWPPPWRALTKEKPELAKEVMIKWRTETLPNNGLVARLDVPQEIVDKAAAILFSLHQTESGKRILDRMELSRFEPATEKTYEPVIEFLKKFDQHVRQVEH